MSDENNNVVDYEVEILKYIKNSLNGVSITDIANEKNFSRNTVAKYVTLLENKKLIIKKKVGTSKLLFSVRNGNLPSSLIISYYKMLLKGLKEKYPSDAHVMKEIGKEGGEFIEHMIPPRTLEQLKSMDLQHITEKHVEIFKNLYITFDVLQPDVKITLIEGDFENQKILLRFTNSMFLDGSEELIYHIYFICGIAELLFSVIFKRTVMVNLEKTHLDGKKEFSYFDLLIELK